MTTPWARELSLPAFAALALLGGACRSAVDAAPETPATRPEAAEVSPPEAPPADGETYKNTIKWSTASELDNFGFDVFRGHTPDGPFDRLNADPIEGGGTTDEPRRYQFEDDTIDPRKTYFYYVESISMSGVRERFTPVGEAKPKIPPTDAGAPD